MPDAEVTAASRSAETAHMPAPAGVGAADRVAGTGVDVAFVRVRVKIRTMRSATTWSACRVPITPTLVPTGNALPSNGLRAVPNRVPGAISTVTGAPWAGATVQLT